MFKYLLTSMISLSCTYFSLEAAQLNLFPIETEKVRERILCLECGHLIYFLEGGKIIYLRKAPYEEQTLSEWWNETEHSQPDSKYFFRLQDWNNSTLFQLYRYEWEINWCTHPFQMLFNDHPELEHEYPFIIENKKTGQMTLCQIWNLTDFGLFIIRYGRQRYDEGWIDGDDDDD